MTIQSIIQDLRLKSTYLADLVGAGDLAWMMGSKPGRNYVVKKADAAFYMTQVDSYVGNPHSTPDVPRRPSAAQLSTIARVSDERFYLKPEGKWKEGQPVETTVAWAVVEDPMIPQLQGHFEATLKSVTSLCAGFFPNQEKGRGSPASKDVQWVRNGNGFMVAHNLCEACSRSVTGAYSDIQRAPLQHRRNASERSCAVQRNDAFACEAWPVRNPRMRAELNKIKQTHFIAPLRAFDQFGNRIPPEEYEEKLRGAVVSLTFTLRHWYDGKHHFTADIQKIKVLLPPAAYY